MNASSHGGPATGHGTAPRVVLAGWYGAANLGDELLLKTISGWVREAGAVPVAISTHPAFTQATMGIEAVGYGDLSAIVEAMCGADLFVLGGGGLFQDYNDFDAASLARFPAWNVSQYAQFLFLADELGLPTLALAQGVGPLRGAEGRAIAADVFTRATALSVRDAGSAQLLREIGVGREVLVAPDPGWSWPPARLDTPTVHARYPQLAGKPTLAMILRDWPFDPEWEAACVGALRTLPPDWGVLWLDFHRPPDAAASGFGEIAQRMVAKLGAPRAHAVWDGATVDEAADLLVQCDACVAMRLHGVLLAVAAGLPVVSIEYDGKVAALGQELDLGSSQRVRLDEIATRLPDAIAQVTHASREARVVPARVVAGLAQRALAHRDLLWRHVDMARTAWTRARDRGDRSRWLGRWLADDPGAASRASAALLHRLRRVLAARD